MILEDPVEKQHVRFQGGLSRLWDAEMCESIIREGLTAYIRGQLVANGERFGRHACSAWVARVRE